MFAGFVFYNDNVRMAERSKALRSGRSPVFWARVRIPLLTTLYICQFFKGISRFVVNP